MNSVIKELNLENFKSTNTKISLMLFVYDFMSISRCTEFLENLKTINYFNFITNLFFSSSNDIIQTIYINQIQILLEDTNEKWLMEILFKNNFIEQALSINFTNTNSFGIKDNNLYIHLCELFNILTHNTYMLELIKKNNQFEKISNFYTNNFKNYVERMEKSICNFRSNSLYLPVEDSLRVDEISEKVEIKNMGEFNRFNNNIFKKNSFSSSVKKDIFFDGQPEGDIEKREDNFDDDNENKNIFQNFYNFDEESQKDDKK